MKKQGIVVSVFSILAAVYIVLSVILTKNKNSIFWTGFGFVLFSIIIMTIITMFSTQKRSAAFPIEISIITFSAVYVAAVFCINILCGCILKATVNVFVSVHLICLALYAITILILYVTKFGVLKQNNAVNGKICEMQVLIYEFEKVKTKLIDMQGDSRKKALTMIDDLLEELRFSDFGITVDVSDIDSKLRSEAECLSSEIDNLIAVKSEDLTSIESTINEIKKTIKDRNMQIRLMSSNI